MRPTKREMEECLGGKKMKKDTRERIERYTQEIPHVKEKLFITGLGLLMATVMTVSASFAWIMLSVAPEVSSINTTLASNGSLEIALSNDKGTDPEESDIDEQALPSDELSATNVQWGNLVSLNDPSYGISDLTLRPAQLNTGALGTSPLWAASYGEDGRITGLGSKFVYAKYDPDHKQFSASPNFGVRAISSYKTETTEATAQEYEVKYNALLKAHRNVNEFYSTNITTKFVNGNLEGVIGDLGGIVSVYLQSIINGTPYRISSETNLPLNEKQVTALLTLYQTLQQGMERQMGVLVQLANLQQYVYSRQHIDENNQPLFYTDLSWDNLLTGKETYDSNGTSHKKPSDREDPIDAVSINGLKQFIDDLDTVQKNITALENHIKNIGNVKTDDVKPQINDVCDPYQAKVDGYTVKQWLNRGLGQLANLAHGHHLVQICNGTLRNFEQFAIDADSRLPQSTKKEYSQNEDKNATVLRATAHVLSANFPIKMTAHVCTNANGDSYFMSDFGALPADINASQKVAEDTYGMAIDLWLRTNSEKTYLTLEGAVVKDAENGTVSSFDGVNRVWNTIPNAALTSNSTTQGNGSCYTYYVDTPEDLQRSLRLLKNMKVAFFGTADGNKFATAVMDVENYYAQNGRVTVPLVIDTKDCMEYTYEDTINSVEKTGYAIKEMYTDEAIRVTALIYLDGENLTNEDVLAAETILGQLNIQFGSSVPLTTAGDRTLESAQRYVTAELSNSTNLEFIKGQTLPKTDVTVTVQGKQPEKMTAYFVRSINDLQGTRQEEMTFQSDKQSGTWKSTHAFTAPGNYWLRHIRMDGVDYELVTPLSVKVTGFDVTSVTWDKGATPYTYYTVNDSQDVSVDVNLAFDKEANTPHAVTAVFMGDDGNAINIRTSAKDGTAKVWSGKVTFTDSGTYTLSHVIVDGNYYDVNSPKKVMNLYFGLSAAIYNDGCTTEDKFDKDSPNKTYEKAVNVSILDNSGNELPELKDTVTLNYSLGGSSTTIPTTLKWSSDAKCYTGTIVLQNPGRYIFSSLQIGNDTIRKVVMSPTYTIMAPDAPQYDSNSATGHNDATGKQYALQGDKAYINGIKIDNSESAGISAVLYNEAAKKYYLVARGDNDTAPGTIYLTENKTWSIRLPDTAEDNSVTAIDGKWSVVCMKLWNCYDGASTTACTGDNPLVWLNTTAEAEAYAKKKGLTASKSIDFSKLNTDVISTITVKMTPGNTKLGDRNAAFMAQHKVSELGISVKFSDYMGNPIPQEKLSAVTLNINYQANKNAATYGYEVMDSANCIYAIPLTYSSDHWDIKTTNYIWQYVGEYEVTGLQVTASGITKNYTHDNTNEIPAMYTVTSKAPSVEILQVEEITQPATEFGKNDAGAVVGTFLQAYNPNIAVKLKLNAKDADGRQHAVVPGVTMKLTMTYQNGTTAPNGGYSWSGNSGYENISVTMVKNPNNYTFTSSGEHVLLAGKYALKGTIVMGETEKDIGSLNSIQAYSVLPELAIESVPRNTSYINPQGGTTAVDSDLIRRNNYSQKNYAVVHMHCKTGSGNPPKAVYEAPIVKMRFDKLGTIGTTKLLIAGDKPEVNIIRTFPNDPTRWDQVVGQGGNGVEPILFGMHTVNSVTTTVAVNEKAITFTRSLEYPVTIRQTNDPLPKLTYELPEKGLKTASVCIILTPIANGSGVDVFKTITVILEAADGYANPRMAKPSNVDTWVKEEDPEKATYYFNMPLTDTTLKMEVTEYPSVKFTSNDNTSTVVKVDGNQIASGTKIKPGKEVTVTVTANRDNHYCLPQLTAPAGITLSKTDSDDYRTVYTFTMPDKEVTIPEPAVTQMHKISWGDETAKQLRLTITCDGETVGNGGYAIPGKKVTMVARAIAGTNPQVTIAGVTLTANTNSDTVTSRTYTFTMPEKDITVTGIRTPAPVRALTFNNDASTFAKIVSIAVDGEPTDTSAMPMINVDIPVDSEVKITLQPAAKTAYKNGFYSPSMTAPANVTDLTRLSTSYQEARYSFTMPDVAVDLNSYVSAIEAPGVRIRYLGEKPPCYRATYYWNDYDGKSDFSNMFMSDMEGVTSDVRFTALPGTTVEVHPIDAIAGIKITGDTVAVSFTGEYDKYDRKIFRFTMGTKPVVLTFSAGE